MTSRFRNELTVVPPVRISVRRKGLSTTINWDANGADRSLFGARDSLRTIGDPRFAGSLPTEPYLIPGTRKDFGGGDIRTMTSSGLDRFKDLLLATRQREQEIRADAKKAKWQLALSWTTRAIAWGTLAAAISKTVRAKTDTAVALRRSEIDNLQRNLAASRVSISFDMETEVACPHRRMLEAFDQLCGSHKSWVLEMAQQIDRVRARSVAGTVVSRNPASLGRRADDLVDTTDLPLAIAVQNGRAQAYFYPGFVLVVSNAGSDFAIIDLTEMEISYEGTRFTEEEAMPHDAQMVGKAWAKSNKDGTRDRRFKDNREFPIMRYGNVFLTSPGGMDEALMFSRDDACRAFVAATLDLQQTLRSMHRGRFSGGRLALTDT